MNREQIIVRTSIIGIITNILLVAAKATIGFIAGSISVVLDAVNNLTDALSSVVTVVGTKLSTKKPDKDHPYGHGRIEYVTTLIVAIIVLIAGGTAIYESISSLVKGKVTSLLICLNLLSFSSKMSLVNNTTTTSTPIFYHKTLILKRHKYN